MLTKVRGGRTQIRFDDELKGLVFGFAGDERPQRDTVDLLNDMTVDFISRVTAQAANYSRARGTGLTVESVMYPIRGDARRLKRINELVEAHDKIKRLRGVFREVTVASMKSDRQVVDSSEASKVLKKGRPSAATNKEPVPRKKKAESGMGKNLSGLAAAASKVGTEERKGKEFPM